VNEKQMFDYESVADQYKIDKKTLDKILSDLREEFPARDFPPGLCPSRNSL